MHTRVWCHFSTLTIVSGYFRQCPNRAGCGFLVLPLACRAKIVVTETPDLSEKVIPQWKFSALQQVTVTSVWTGGASLLTKKGRRRNTTNKKIRKKGYQNWWQRDYWHKQYIKCFEVKKKFKIPDDFSGVFLRKLLSVLQNLQSSDLQNLIFCW